MHSNAAGVHLHYIHNQAISPQAMSSTTTHRQVTLPDKAFYSFLSLGIRVVHALLIACLPGTRLLSEEPTSEPVVRTGIEVLKRDNFRGLRGQRVGLISNHTGVDWQGNPTAVLLHESSDVALTTLFSPEHGFRGVLDQSDIGDAKDDATGLKIYSLYGQTRKPTTEMLSNVDTIVFDIQDIGARFYTYISTMGEAMKAADQSGKRFVVLDRPNPINGVDVAGPMLDPGDESFVGFHHLPIRHGMTIGELAKMFRSELGLSLDLEIVRCEGWRREMTFDQTGLVWINPSPNMRSLTQALLYPGVGMLETSNLSVGRGTDTPFEVIGASWIDPIEWAKEMRSEQIPGVTVVPIQFTPDSSRYRDEVCGGINLVISNRAKFDPLHLGVALAVTLQRLYPDQWQAEKAMRLLGNRATMNAIVGGQSVSEVMRVTNQNVDQFRQRRSQFLLY